ncbi:MAG: isoprenylcysteine carboxylmethyltransferase family protein [Bacteroidetes bacterium]|nr:isoprenylcysteine carboxylmethyltransferase family protein [Bacteroidota bacterium]
MQIHGMIILASFVATLVSVFVVALITRNKVDNYIGKPTIDKWLFYSSKASMVITWIFLIAKAVDPGLGLWAIPSIISWFATILTVIASFILILAFAGLGTSLRVGLPNSDAALKTKGIYSISRNPIYLGGFILSIASLIYFPNQVNLVFVFYAIFIHHRIILAEEKFLSVRFGQEWEEYTKKVRRYL